MKNFAAILLAAGKGTRMKSSLPKVLHEVCGRPMLYYPLKTLKELGVKKTIVVVGYGADTIRDAVKAFRCAFTLQRPLLGTGHAVLCAMRELKGFSGDILILSGDAPLITKETVRGLFKIHRRGAALSLISAVLEDPHGYGRIIRDASGRVEKIVEEKELKGNESKTREVNAGVYLADSGFLRENLGKIKKNNRKKEYFLPDLASLAYKKGLKVACLIHLEPEQVMGVNTRVELARANSVMRRRVLISLMLEGTTIIDPEATYIDYGVKTGRDSTVYPNAHLSGNTVIGDGCTIEEGARIKDSTIGDGSVVRSFSVVESSVLGRHACVGPFARIRPGSVVSEGARIGNFVEVKKSFVGKATKANHLSYIGDAEIGRNVNIGAGTITCNYDGFKKWKTIIEDGAFIGSDTQLVAPVRVGRGAYIGSGSTITKDVPSGSLALSRAEQKNIKGWARRKKEGSSPRKRRA